MAVYDMLTQPRYNCANITAILLELETIPDDEEQQAELFSAIQKACTSTPNPSIITQEELLKDFPGYMRAIGILRMYVPPILLILGTFGNFFSFIILAKTMFKVSTYSYLAVLAVMDLLVLYVGLLRMWVGDFSVDIQTSSTWMCKLVNFLGYVCSDISVWLIIAVTTERFIAVSVPLRAPRMCNVHRARWVIVAIIFIICAINAHIIWTVELRSSVKHNGSSTPQCRAGHKHEILVDEVWPWVDAAMYSFVPFVVITILNVLIIRKVLYARKRRTLLQHSELTSKINSVVYQQQTKRGNESSKKLTFMLLAVSFTFLLTTLPMNVFTIVKAFFGPDKQTSTANYKEKFVKYFLSRTVVELLMYVNHSINFFLYCATGRKFRRQFRAMVCMCCHGQLIEFFRSRTRRHQPLTPSNSYRLTRLNSHSTTSPRSLVIECDKRFMLGHNRRI